MAGATDELFTPSHRRRIVLGATERSAALDAGIERLGIGMEVLLDMNTTSDIGTVIPCAPATPGI